MAGAAPPLPEMAASTSCLVTRPRGPLPPTAPRSMPCSAAIRAATGVASASPLTGAGASVPGRAASTLGAGAACAGAPAPASIRHSSGADRHRLVGFHQQLGDRAGHGRGHLGVDLVGGDLDQRVVDRHGVAGLDAPLEDRALGHRVAHLREGDVHGLAGRLAGSSPLEAPSAGAADGRPRPRARRRTRSRRAPARPAPSRPGPRGSPRARPAAGDGTSASTLSVDTSTIGSSTATVSPTCLSHSRTVPSVTDSPMAGMVIWTLVPCVAIRHGHSTRAAGTPRAVRPPRTTSERVRRRWP